MSVGSIGGSTFNPQAMASKMAAAIMKEADKDGNGTLSKTELTAFKDSKGGRGPDVDQVFSTDNSSELTQSELQSFIETEGARMQAKGGKPSGPPPAQMNAASGDASSTDSSASSSKSSTDPMDKNQDGRVSEAEIQAYALAHPDLNKVVVRRAADAGANRTAGQRSLDISI